MLYGHFRSSCFVAAALLQRKQTFALIARPTLGRYHLSTFSWCSPSSAEVSPITPDLWTLWKLVPVETKLIALGLEHTLVYLSTSAAISCHLQLQDSLSSTHKELLHPLNKPQQNTLRSEMTRIYMNKAFVRACLHSTRVTHSPSSLHCVMHRTKASPQPCKSLSLSALLRCCNQPKSRMSQDSNRPSSGAVRAWSLVCSVENSLWVQFLIVIVDVSYTFWLPSEPHNSSKYFLLQQRSKLACSFLFLPWLSSWFTLNILKRWLDWKFFSPNVK